MKVIFIGPQGSGKGTQAKIISKTLDIAHISTGDMLRQASGELKKQVDEVINAGNLISDSLMLEILEQRIKQPDCKNGFILDGYPRNLNQAQDLKKITEIGKIIEIHISDEFAIKRISNRLNCKNCHAIFNRLEDKPKVENTCDHCQTELTQRKDDQPEAIKKRLEIYHKETKPILQEYETIKINGEQKKEKVTEEILNALKD